MRLYDESQWHFKPRASAGAGYDGKEDAIGQLSDEGQGVRLARFDVSHQSQGKQAVAKGDLCFRIRLHSHLPAA
jgi:hypothetical protein